jgi:serine/threonine protein kinase
MVLQAGVRLGAYEILAAAGAGGMGEVYKARDTRLDRVVAIKVLPAEVGASPILRKRFEREARTLSTLTHPHICALLDIGSQDGVEFLVMEFLEGETLAERLQRSKRLSIGDTLAVAIQIADALASAHRQGIVHRDLKPANIMLTRSGAKLLDFGLAKHAESVVEMAGESAVTTAAPITVEGAILGTVPYMAPEQIEGREADTRTDIFAFGSVVYEMVTGRRAFDGASQVALIAAIVERDPPPVTSLLPLSPPWLHQVLKGCLEKDPEKRWQDVRDVHQQLKLIAADTTVDAAPRRNRTFIAAAALVALIAVVAAGVPVFFRAPPPAPAIRMQFELETPFTLTPYQMAFSASGRHLALTVTENDLTQLWVRTTITGRGESLATTASIPGSLGATWPAWSPDERSLAFFSEGKLKTIDLQTLESTTLADAPRPHGVTWGAENEILYSTNQRIFRISARGGTPLPLLELESDGDAVTHPQFLPDGRNFIYLVSSERQDRRGVFVTSLGARKVQRLVATFARASVVLPGYLLFVRPGESATEATLMMQRFDLSTLQMIGDALPLAENVGVNTNNRAAAFTVSHTGLLVHRGNVTGTAVSNLKWFDRRGDSRAAIDAVAEYTTPALSPDGARAVVVRVVRTIGETDLWMVDLTRGTTRRFTSGAAAELLPKWSPDGARIVFTSNRTGDADTAIYEKHADGSSPEQLLLPGSGSYAESWSPDAKYLLYRHFNPETQSDLWILPVAERAAPKPFLRSRATEISARFSPDGRWVAYQSNESGRDEVYLTNFPDGTAALQVSVGGGRAPRWRGDGRELFFDRPAEGLSAITAIDIDLASSPPRIGKPRSLFVTATDGWDVTRDGQRFLMVVPTDNAQRARTVPPLTFVAHWLPAQN